VVEFTLTATVAAVFLTTPGLSINVGARYSHEIIVGANYSPDFIVEKCRRAGGFFSRAVSALGNPRRSHQSAELYLAAAG
jgi:hypothetical protein